MMGLLTWAYAQLLAEPCSVSLRNVRYKIVKVVRAVMVEGHLNVMIPRERLKCRLSANHRRLTCWANLNSTLIGQSADREHYSVL